MAFVAESELVDEIPGAGIDAGIAAEAVVVLVIVFADVVEAVAFVAA